MSRSEKRFALCFAPVFSKIEEARAALTAFLRRDAPAGTASLSGDLCLAATEALNNVAEHSGASRVEIACEIFSAEVRLTIKDDGKPFDPTRGVGRPGPEAGPAPEGGYGRSIVMAFADSVRYRRQGLMNVLTLRKFWSAVPRREMSMEINISMEGDVVVMDLAGDLVASTAGQLKAEVEKLVEKRFHHILLDMGAVNFMDSSGLGACMAVHKMLLQSGGLLICAQPSEAVGKIFRVTQADQKLRIVQNRGEGVRALHAYATGGPQ